MADEYLTPLPELDRIQVFGDQLVEVHGWLRQELRAVREEVDAYLAGRSAAPVHGHTPPGLGADLHRHCMAFCEALHGHHTGEDAVLFPAMEEDFPELAPVLAKLRGEHEVIGRVLAELEAVLAGAEAAEPQRIRAELARLSTELDTHLSYEEEQLVAAMNAIPRQRVEQIMQQAE